jgi:hypothetical protein
MSAQEDALDWAAEKVLRAPKLLSRLRSPEPSTSMEVKRLVKEARETIMIKQMLERTFELSDKIRLEVSLWRRTGDPKHFRQMRYFIEKKRLTERAILRTYRRKMTEIARLLKDS